MQRRCSSTSRSIVLGLLLSASATLSLCAAEIYPKASRKKGGPPSVNKTVAVLDEILHHEQQLLQAVEEIKSELAIVKARASLPKRVVQVLSTGASCP